MKFITQKNNLDCGIAVCAMISGITYTKASMLDKKFYSTKGLNLSEFKEIMAMTGHPVEVTKRHYKKPISDIYLADIQGCGVLIKCPENGFTHWITSDGKHIFDPWFTKKSRHDTYEFHAWTILRVLTPAPTVAGTTTT